MDGAKRQISDTDGVCERDRERKEREKGRKSDGRNPDCKVVM